MLILFHSPTNILNVSQIPSEVEEKMWLEVDHNITKDKDNILEKPFGNAKRSSKKEVRIRFTLLVVFLLFCH